MVHSIYMVFLARNAGKVIVNSRTPGSAGNFIFKLFEIFLTPSLQRGMLRWINLVESLPKLDTGFIVWETGCSIHRFWQFTAGFKMSTTTFCPPEKDRVLLFFRLRPYVIAARAATTASGSWRICWCSCSTARNWTKRSACMAHRSSLCLPLTFDLLCEG